MFFKIIKQFLIYAFFIFRTSLVLLILWYFTRKMLATFIFLIFQSLVCALLVFYESCTLNCTTATFEISSFCLEFRQTLNACSSSNITETAIPEDKFKIGRVITVFMALLTLFCGITICIIIAVSMKVGIVFQNESVCKLYITGNFNTVTTFLCLLMTMHCCN